jgi:methionyl-tRNA synthetase
MKKKSYYITTTLPYVNAEPHIGFGMEIVAADTLARFHGLLGEDVVFNTGTDEHGSKIYQEAVKSNQTPQAYVDHYAAKFSELKSLLHLSYTNFIRTTNPDHVLAAQAFWKLCVAKGDIYKKEYSIKYCVGCELEKTDSELVEGKCPLHPSKELELIEEENYFFRFSNYQEALLDLYARHPDFVQPTGKMHEIKAFVAGGLTDFSISRLRSKMPWGISVPGDETQVMYVWFDALINYISTIGWSKDLTKFESYWPVVQIAGKDNLRQQAAMWQAMLLSANVPPSKQILINGFISIGGQKMSKSLGNVISPAELVGRYGVDGARFLLLDMGPVHDDIDITREQLDSRYESFLANGLGNTVSRVAALAAKSDAEFATSNLTEIDPLVKIQLDAYRFDLALNEVWKRLSSIDQEIELKQPWRLSGVELRTVLEPWVKKIQQIGYDLQPFMPETAAKIMHHYEMQKITKIEALFPRLSTSSL